MSKLDEINAILDDKALTMPEALTNLARQGGHPHPTANTTPEGIQNVNETLKDSLKPENIRAGVNILGCFGTLEGAGSAVPSYAGVFKVDPTDRVQTLETAGKVMQHNVQIGGAKATVDPNIKPENIRKDVTILDVVGTLEEKKPDYQGNVRVTPTTHMIVLPTAGKTLNSDIEIDGVNLSDRLMPDIIRTFGKLVVELVWNESATLIDQDIDLDDVGELRNGLALISHVGTGVGTGRLNLRIFSHNNSPLILGARTTGGITSSLFAYFDVTFFKPGQKEILFEDGGGEVTCVLSSEVYDTPASAACFDWIITDEDATAWLTHLSDRKNSRKYVKFADGNMVAGPVKDQYSAKGYTVVDEELA